VGRPTVYAHFPDELSLGKACSSLGLAENPPPDPGSWEEFSDPERRLRVALAELYAYFRRGERMLANVLRDAEREWEAKPHVREIMEPLIEHWERMKETLAAGWEVGEVHPQPLLGAIGLALDFETWHTMVRKQGLTDEQAIDLMAGMVRCAMHG
jgi:hypothetical protein